MKKKVFSKVRDSVSIEVEGEDHHGNHETLENLGGGFF